MPDSLPMPKHVLNLWRVQCRRLSFSKAERSTLVLHIAIRTINEREVVKSIKKRFTPEWWAGVLITEVEEVGRLHMIEDQPLYEED